MVFNRGIETSSVVKKDILIWDYLKKIEKEISSYNVLYLYTNKLQNQSIRSVQRQSLVEALENVTKKNKGEIFSLPNENIVVYFHNSIREEILACMIKIRFIFHDDPIFKNVDDFEKVGFAKIYSLSSDLQAFKQKIEADMQDASLGKKTPIIKSNNVQENNYYQPQVRKLRRELTPSVLAKIQKNLAMTDFSSYIRRQAICAIIGKSQPQMIFEEVFVSIPDLREILLPDVDLTANPWLFLSLSETLDKRMLETISRHDDGSLIGNFSININVSTILSDKFLEFDDNINPSMRSSIVLELQLADIFSDIKAFFLAKTFAQSRGYKVCIDGITVDKLKYINREQLNVDLIKIIWHPSFLETINEDKHFTDYVNKAERAKMILCRIDTPDAVAVGNSLGINLYQGRYIQRMLNSQPKKTIFTIKK